MCIPGFYCRRNSFFSTVYSRISFGVFGSVLVFLATGFDGLHAEEYRVANSPSFSVRYNEALINQAEFSADGKLIAAVGAEKIEIRNASDGKVVRTPGKYNVKATRVRFTPSGKYLVVFGYEKPTGSVRIYRVSDGSLVKKLGSYSSDGPIAIAPDNDTLAVAASPPENTKQQLLELWSIRTGKKLFTLSQKRTYDYVADSLDFTPNGKQLVVGVANQQKGIEIWDVAEGRRMSHIPTDMDVTAVVVDPNRPVIYAGLLRARNRTQPGGGFVDTYSLDSRKRIGRLAEYNGHISALSFLAERQLLGVSVFGKSPSFAVLDTKSGKTVYAHKKGRRPTIHIDLSPTGRSLLVVVNTYGNLGNPTRLEIFGMGSKKELRKTGGLNDMKTFQAGDRVRAKIDGKWYTGKVHRLGKRNYLLKMDNARPEYWKWMEPGDLRPQD